MTTRGALRIMFALTGVAAMIGLGVWIGVGYVSVAGVATPTYKVLEKKDGYEIREYAPRIVAEVTMNAGYRDALNGGFRKLADYIFGNNTKAPSPEGDATPKSEKIAMTAPVIEREQPSEKIAMTAPVLERDTADAAHVISFVMPREYTMATLPKPNNPDVRVVELPACRYAVLSFSGTATEKKAAEKRAQLQELVARDGIATVGLPLLAQYNPPWTPPFMRKNEVWLELK